MLALARAAVLSMATLAVFVQLAVWGATKIRGPGALLQSWQPYFGWEYGLAFAAVQLAICRWLAVERGVVWLARAWTFGGALIVISWWLGGRAGPPAADEAVALVSGFGAVVLAVGLYDGRLLVGHR